MKYTFHFLSLLLLVAFSCTEEIQPTPYDYTYQITGANSKTWKLKYIELMVDGESVITTTDNCSMDDRFTFYANSEHALVVTTGAVKCYPDDPEGNTLITSWSFTNSTATLVMLYPPITMEGLLPMTLIEVKKSKMEVELYLGGTTTYRIHFDAVTED